MSYVGVTPVQPAIAHALVHESAWLADMVAGLATNRDLLGAALRDAGFGVHATAGTYFTVADIAPLGYTDGVEFCLDLPEKAGVAAIPVQVFCDDPGPWLTKVRFAFCKTPATLAEAARRLTTIR